MKIVLLDMDGVLLRSAGYHQALHDTVLRVSRSRGLPGFKLSAADIARFEAVGITNEWHSSAVCAALLSLNHGQNETKSTLDRLFEVLAGQARDLPPLSRAREAIRILAGDWGLEADGAVRLIETSESPGLSETFDLFQEMILGSDLFEKTYGGPRRLSTPSYLERFDLPLLDERTRERLISWLDHPQHGLAILTNRPSRSMPDSPSTPEAQIGARQVGLPDAAIVGQGEMIWLARQVGLADTSLLKPDGAHALAAVRAASGRSLERSLLEAHATTIRQDVDWRFVHGSVVAVLEDTTAGLISAEKAQMQLKSAGIRIDLQKIGIASEPVKRAALAERGATVYKSVNQALAAILG